MPSFVRQSMARELTRRIKENASYFVTGYQGFSADKLGGLRYKLASQAARFMVVKNSVARKVFKNVKLEPLSGHLEGPTAITFVKDSPELISKILVDFAKENESFSVRGAYVDGEVWDAQMVKGIAALPSREVLIAQTVSQIKAPLYGLVGTLSAVTRQLVWVLSALKEKQAKEASA